MTATTERNEQIKAAFIAGNTNKTELASHFGVSVSTIRRVLVGVVIAAASVGTAQASNVDVNNFFVKAEAVASNPSDHNARNEAVNAYDNLNARDQLIVDTFHTQAGIDNVFPDIKGSADNRGHQHVIPQGWNRDATLKEINQANATPSAPPVAGSRADSVLSGLGIKIADIGTGSQDQSNTQTKAESVLAGLGIKLDEIGTGSQSNAVQAERKDRFDGLKQAKAYQERSQGQVDALHTAEAEHAKEVTEASHKHFLELEGKSKVADNQHRTQQQTDALNAAHVTRFNQLKAEQGEQQAEAYRERSASQHIDSTSAQIADVKSGVTSAQQTAQTALNDSAVVNGKADTIQKEVMTIDSRVDGVESTANTADQKADQAQKAVDANNTRDDQQDKSIHHAQTNADAALKGNIAQSQFIKDNADNIDTLKGVALQEANRERTSQQHVAAPAPKDGVNGKDGVTTIITKTDTTTQDAVKGLQLVQANQQRTAQQHVTEQPKDGVNGADGVTTIITKADTATQAKVASNSGEIRSIRKEQAAQGEYVQAQTQVINQHSSAIRSNTAQIERNSSQINRNKQDIEDTKQDLKRGLNNAAAMTGLHYHSNDSYAVSVGSANGEGAAIAGGLSHSITEHTAATVQASSSMDGGWMVSAGFSGDF
ncbi:TPA: hypothetical protein JLG68_001361 [Escherichia coli]|nr:hypothetical protein [Escherichia coli]